MGQRLIALAGEDPQLRIVAALESDRHPALGQDAGIVAGIGEMGIPLSTHFPADVDVVIDFSIPAAAMALLGQCVEAGTPLVLATTGFSQDQQEAIGHAARQIPVVWAPSMSTAVNLAMKLTEVAAQGLKDLPCGRRCRDYRATPPLQGGCPQRHGIAFRTDRSGRHGTNGPGPWPRRPPGPTPAK